MPYTPGASVASGPYTVGGNQTYQQANNDTTQYLEAVNSLEQDLFTPFVYGLGSFVATKNGTTASQLDVTAGVAFLLQTDNTLRRRAPTSSTQSTTGHPSTTMFLDLNPDGTWSWGTSHSAVSGHLTIASVTTDSSANIAVVTDARVLSTALLAGMAGAVQLGQLSSDGGKIVSDGAGTFTAVSLDISTNIAGGQRGFFTWDAAGNGNMRYAAPLGGASAHGIYFLTWTGSTSITPFSIGGSLNGAPAYVDDSGNITGVNITGSSFSGGNFTGSIFSGASVSLTGGISAGSTIFQQGSSVGLTGSHSVAQIALSYGSGAPASLNSNEIYFQIS